MRATTDIPGRSRSAAGWSGSIRIRTAIRCATLTKLPVALSGRSTANSEPAAGARFCAACHETTGGNPFLIRELLHEVLDKQVHATDAEAATVRELGPEAISTVVLGRLQRLPASAPAMARAIALLGEGANALGDGRVASELLKVGGSFAESLARLIGGGLGRIGLVHG